MTSRRTVRVTERFFDDLDTLLPPQRTSAGTPSTADFLQYEIPRILELLATNLEGSTAPVAGADDIRVLITSGMLIRHLVAYVFVQTDGLVNVVGLEIER